MALGTSSHDDSRKFECIFKSSDKTIIPFKIWKNLVEKQYGKKTEKLRTCNGLENYNELFDSYFKKHDILKHRNVTRIL